MSDFRDRARRHPLVTVITDSDSSPWEAPAPARYTAKLSTRIAAGALAIAIVLIVAMTVLH